MVLLKWWSIGDSWRVYRPGMMAVMEGMCRGEGEAREEEAGRRRVLMGWS
jgi:hypothetical protein